MAKGWIILGFAAGYVVGSAAGRKQYEKIRASVQDLLDRPEVKRTVKRVDDFVSDKAPVVHDLGAAVVESAGAQPDSGEQSDSGKQADSGDHADEGSQSDEGSETAPAGSTS